MRFMRFLIILLALSSCSSQWHLKRAIAKDPTISNDTIVRVDTTIVTQSISVVDTLVIRDTITREIARDGVVVRLQRIHDTIRVNVVCPPDTIRVVTEVPVEQVVIRKNAMPLFRRMMAFLYLIMSIVLVAWIYRLTK